MEKIRSKSVNRLVLKESLPVLTSNTITHNFTPKKRHHSHLRKNSSDHLFSTCEKPRMTLSKFDLDNKLASRQEKRLKILSSLEYPEVRMQKSTSIKKQNFTKNNLIEVKLITVENKNTGTLTRNFSKNLQNKLILNTPDQKTPKDPVQSLVEKTNSVKAFQSKSGIVITNSKVSSKNYGLVRGYAANSHPGLNSLLNDDRICIITNLNKTSAKSMQVSFFSIFEGSQNKIKADYYRDNLHVILNSLQNKEKQSLLLTDPQKALKLAIQKVQQLARFQCPPELKNTKISYCLLLVVGQKGFLVNSGNNKVVISKQLGSKIEKNSPKNRSQNKVIHHKTNFTNRNKNNTVTNVILNKIDLAHQNSIDFAVLGSEGLFENNREQEIVKRVWADIIKNSQGVSIHYVLGEATVQLLYYTLSNHPTKSVSSVLVGFENIQDCLNGQKSQDLKIPHLEG